MKTKRIRIAVCVDPAGVWTASGWSTDTGGDISDEHLRNEAEMAMEGFGDLDSSRLVWVTAEVPLPELPQDVEVDGEVQP